MKELEHYVAFRRLKNFACVKLHNKDLQVWTRLDPSSVTLEEGFTRDVSQIGHAGTGDLEIRIQNCGRSGTRPAASAAQLSRGLILSVAVFADSLVISALFELFAQPRSIGQRPQ